MTIRLMRALQKGGVAAKLRSDQWGVWRQQDRRGRVIGCLSDREVERLQLRECLKPLGEAADTLVWSGSAIDPRSDRGVSNQPNLLRPQMPASAPYIESIILKQTAPAFRESLRRAVLKFRRDMHAVSVPSASVTMNWERLHVEDKQARSYKEGGFVKSRAQRLAASNMQAIERAFSPTEFNFLTHLVCAEGAKAWLAKHHSLQMSMVEPKALSVLRQLISAQGSSR